MGKLFDRTDHEFTGKKTRKRRRCFGCKQIIEIGQTYTKEDYLDWHYPECPTLLQPAGNITEDVDG